MCECFKVGGPFIAEDPNCPVHGYAAQHEARIRNRELDSLETEIEQAETVEELRELMLKMIGIMRGQYV